MLVIENINKIVGRQIDHKWEVAFIRNFEGERGYYFGLENVGVYKHYQWAIVIDRNIFGEGYRMYCFDHNKEYETYIKPNEIGSIDRVVSEMALLIEKSKE